MFLPVEREFFLPLLPSPNYRLVVGFLSNIVGSLLYNIKCLEVAVVLNWYEMNFLSLVVCGHTVLHTCDNICVFLCD